MIKQIRNAFRTAGCYAGSSARLLQKKLTAPLSSLGLCLSIIALVFVNSPGVTQAMSTLIQNDWSGGTGTGTNQFASNNGFVTSVGGELRIDTSGPSNASSWCNTATCNSSFVRRKPVTIKNPTSTTYTNHTVKLKVAFETDMKPNLGDLRFTSSDSQTDLTYTILFAGGTAETSDVIVKVPSLPANSDTTIKMYYGNPSAETTASPENALLFTDGFDYPVHGKGNLTYNTGGQGTGPLQLYGPAGVASDFYQRAWVLDQYNHRVQIYDSAGVLAGDGSFGSQGNGDGQFQDLVSITFDKAVNQMAILDSTNRVQWFNMSGVWQRTITLPTTGSGGVNNPQSISMDITGTLWVADTGNNQVSAFNSAGGNHYFSFDGSISGLGSFSAPNGITNANGYLFVLDSGNSRVMKFDTSGNYSYMNIGGVGSGRGQFINPSSIAVDDQSNFYVADEYRVQKFDPVGLKRGQWSVGDQTITASPDFDGHVFVTLKNNHSLTRYDAPKLGAQWTDPGAPGYSTENGNDIKLLPGYTLSMSNKTDPALDRSLDRVFEFNATADLSGASCPGTQYTYTITHTDYQSYALIKPDNCGGIEGETPFYNMRPDDPTNLRVHDGQQIRYRYIARANGDMEKYYSIDSGQTYVLYNTDNSSSFAPIVFAVAAHDFPVTISDVIAYTDIPQIVTAIPATAEFYGGYSAQLESRDFYLGSQHTTFGNAKITKSGTGDVGLYFRTSGSEWLACGELQDGESLNNSSCVTPGSQDVQYMINATVSSDLNLVITETGFEYLADDTPPTLPDNLTIKTENAGSTISPGASTYDSTPYFSWDASTDVDSSVAGYCLYLGDSATDLPTASKGLLPDSSPANSNGQCPYAVSATDLDLSQITLSSPLQAGTHYYFRVQPYDSWFNIQTSAAETDFTFDVDSTPPSEASSLTIKTSSTGTTINAGSWTRAATPYFEWTAATDDKTSVRGYCLYLGTSDTADPITAAGDLKDFTFGSDYKGEDPQGACRWFTTSTHLDTSIPSTMLQSGLGNNTQYYLIIKAVDATGNVSSGAQTNLKVDTSPPYALTLATSPSVTGSKIFRVDWLYNQLIQYGDGESGFAGMKYCTTTISLGFQGCDIGNNEQSNWYGLDHSSGDIHDASDVIPISDAGFSTVAADADRMTDLPGDVNFIRIVAVDYAGNTYLVSDGLVTVVSHMPPSPPQNLTVNTPSNSENRFSFTWTQPTFSFGSTSELDYCWTVNVTIAQDQSNCNWTGRGIYALAEGAYATQQGTNTLYLAAKDVTGNFDSTQYASIDFSASTASPGAPQDLDSSDVSIKANNNWRLAFTWTPPAQPGSGIASYKLFRSTDNNNFSEIGTTSANNTSFIDSGLTQQLYYYYVKACDNANSCSVASNTVSRKPTGRFTVPARLTADTDQPRVKDIGTKKATIYWYTDRESDSKVAVGTKPGQYFPEEISNSAQLSNHTVTLNNLQPNTTYYYIAKWTDLDGNTGQSIERSFTTLPAPVISEVTPGNISITSAGITFRSKDAAKVNLYYGKGVAAGGSKSINTSTRESTYTIALSDLDDGTKYSIKINGVDSDGNEYQGNEYNFTTLPRPRINNLRFQPVVGEPSSTQKITWTTNVASTTGLLYGPRTKTQQELLDSRLVTDHEIIIKDLDDNSDYTLIARSTDAAGNLAVSDLQTFKTALDTRPPKISGVTVEPSILGTGTNAKGQIIVSWKTDEPATSQIAFGQGESGGFTSTTPEDSRLQTDHTVVISNLSVSSIYHLQTVSNDKARNTVRSGAQTTIIGRGSENVFSIIFNAMEKIFGIKN